MSAIDRLVTNYERQVRLPWSANMSGKQRVWFAVYPPVEERRLRARLPQFEALTLAEAFPQQRMVATLSQPLTLSEVIE